MPAKGGCASGAKKLFWPSVIILILIIAWLFVRFVIGGPEDDWLCVNGNWVKHGAPAGPPPVTGCGSPRNTADLGGFCGSATKASCQGDADCVAGGCSGQVCGSATESIVTTCEWTDCYAAQNYGVKCGCVAGECQWYK